MSTSAAIGIRESDGRDLAGDLVSRTRAGWDLDGRMLARYTDPREGERELIVAPAHAGSRVVIDRTSAEADDARLIAHLAPDEPELNAEIVCSEYLRDPSPASCRCLCDADMAFLPAWVVHDLGRTSDLTAASTTEPFALTRVGGGAREVPALRWTGSPAQGGPQVPVLSLRRVIGMLESYEPARTLTLRAVARHRTDPGVSIATLASELDRLASSPIVLNRALRRAVQRAVADGISLSLIAMRCGRVKRDSRGNVSGETSWLGRRLGLLPEGGASRPTPWIHSDVLALIARRGLGISPREVELG
jgi:hypothetical protein